MASGTRSIVWRSDIDAGRERPAFFLCGKGAGKAQLVGQFAGQLAEPANPANPSFSGKGERKEGRKGEGRMGERREKGMGGYLLNK